MSDDVKPSAAWQDVQSWHMSHGNGSATRAYLASDVERARAADAQQIAELTRAVQGNALAVVKANENAAQQIAALKQSAAEVAELNQPNLLIQMEQAQQIAALRAEKENIPQLIRENVELLAQLTELVQAKKQRDDLANFNPDWDMLAATQQSLREHQQLLKALQAEQAQWRREATKWLKRADHGFDPEEPDESVDYWNGVRRCAESILAALTAQQDGSLPARQPKP